jgi:hypothetical protein
MTWADRLGRGFDRAIYAVLPLAVVGPALYLPRGLADPSRTGAEWAVVFAAWTIVLLCAGARAFRGAVPLAPRGLAAAALLALVAWTLATTPLARHPGMHLALAMTVVPVLLASVALGGWVAEAPGRRGAWVLACLAGLLGAELILAGLQAFKVPLASLMERVPEGSLLGSLLAGIQNPEGARVVRGGLSRPAHLAELLVLLVPVAVGAAWGSASRGLRGLGLGLGVAGIALLVLTTARAPFVAAVAAALLASVVGLVAGRRAQSNTGPALRGWSLALAGSGLLVLLVAGQPLGARLAQSGLADGNVAARLGHWAVAVQTWLGTPVWGGGLGCFAADAPRWLLAAHPGGVSQALSLPVMLDLHNEPLQLVLELGVVGFALLGFALWRWERGLHAADDQPLAWRVGLLAGVVGLLVASLAGSPAHVAVTAWALALVVAVGLGLAPVPAPAASPLPAPALVPYGLVVVLALAGAAWASVARGVGAEWWASHELHLMKQVQQVEPNAPGIPLLGAGAADHTRFKRVVVPLVVAELTRRRDPAGALALYDRHVASGVGYDAVLARAQALQALGRKDEAILALREVATFYHPAVRQHRKAARLLARMGQPNPRAAEAEALRKARSQADDGSQATGAIGGKRSAGK